MATMHAHESSQMVFRDVTYNHDANAMTSSTASSSGPNSGRSSSPEAHASDMSAPIPEEDEDETSSETANEPITPTDGQHANHFHHDPHEALQQEGQQIGIASNASKAPVVTNTAPAQPHALVRTESAINRAASERTPLPTPSQSRPTSSRDPHKRGLSGIFRRSNSHMAAPNSNMVSELQASGNSDIALDKTQRRRMSLRRMSATTSPATTRSNSPPSPGHSREPSTSISSEPSQAQFFGPKKNKSSTGLGNLRGMMGITFAHPERERPKRSAYRQRASSFDRESVAQPSDRAGVEKLNRQVWGMPAEAGTGLKARRMSLSLPDDFTCEVVELHNEFSDQSRMLGRRGKMIGKGATSKVTLMTRKGGPVTELYAVKEFRVKARDEDQEEYEKKVKSEFTIANSLHHPNVVETIRLCTHAHKWNHVMEYCSEGDLFGLVHKNYLKSPERMKDRLCLFKQLVQGVNYLHQHGIAHRDIKLENLLVTGQSKLKITDFGVSEVFSGIHPGLRESGGECGRAMGDVRLCDPGICGSLPYIAPEVVAKQGKYDPRPLDVWSSAVVMLHLIFGGALWPEAKAGNRNYDSVLQGWSKWNAKHASGDACITEEDYPYVKAFDLLVNPPALRRMLVTMLNPDPARRSTIAEIASNRWLKNVECCQVDSYDDPSKIIDASKAKNYKTTGAKVVTHSHLPPVVHKGHSLIRLPGSTDMDY